MISKELDEYLEKYNDEPENGGEIQFKSIEKEINGLSKEANLFIMNALTDSIWLHTTFIDTLMVELYTTCLEYMFIPEANDGFHVAKIVRFNIEYTARFLHEYENEEGTVNVIEYIKDNQDRLYNDAKSEIERSLDYQSRFMYDPRGECNKIIDYWHSVSLPKEIPEELHIENIINESSLMDIANKYKSKDCKSEIVYI